MGYDLIVIGGGYAGMSAAMQLVRAHRTVVVVDGGRRRNRSAATAHGFLTQEGADPAQIALTARDQLRAYPTLTWIEGEVEGASGTCDAFEVVLGDGARLQGRRLLLATGVFDELPEIPGLAERWGTSVFHCPYCHAFELAKGRIGVIAGGQDWVQQAELLAEWGRVTLLLNGRAEPGPEEARDLDRRGVELVAAPVARIEGRAEVVLVDGQRHVFEGLFIAPRHVPSSSVAQRLGCALEDVSTGVQVRTDDEHRTSLDGVFACGDVARIPHSLSQAVADGAGAGTQIHQSLVWPGKRLE
ncbi:thioredoxin reductase [Arenimonas soli]|uniref:Thioredoxin reductase n=1 Tax=Arenimonas soli TaxID=2269504 RepID=A0ABQ1HMK8_9GAMM|nr:NAD(P)/FAD-dependent oxidoreductase [Arenimonas soli]GGA83203.1 thioredoxin reductase [Arenimonas soli]